MSIMFIFKSFIKDINGKLCLGKRENRMFNIPVKYKSFGQSLVNCLKPVYSNSMPNQCKKKIHCK